MILKLHRETAPFHLIAENEDGSTIHFDGSETIGGEGKGMRPMQVLASSLAACSSIDVLHILRKQKTEPERYEVTIDAHRADTVPAVFDTIHLIFYFSSEVGLDKAQRAADLSLKKYCSVTKMLEHAVKITHEVKHLES